MKRNTILKHHNHTGIHLCDGDRMVDDEGEEEKKLMDDSSIGGTSLNEGEEESLDLD